MMGGNFKILHFIFIFTIITINFQITFGQKQPDAGMWSTLSIEKEITKKIDICIDQEFRLKNNYSDLNLFYTNISVDYSIYKGIKLSVGYRIIEKYLIEDFFSFRHRLMFDASYKYKIQNIILSYRSRIQAEVRDYYSSKHGQIPEWYWRNKFDIKYDLGKFTPYIGTELRYQISDPRNPSGNHGLHRARMYGGVDYKINNANSIGLYYLVQQEYDIDEPADVYITGIQYTISFK
jgi:hypothetical protein